MFRDVGSIRGGRGVDIQSNTLTSTPLFLKRLEGIPPKHACTHTQSHKHTHTHTHTHTLSLSNTHSLMLSLRLTHITHTRV